MAATELTNDERAFIQRMVPHVMAGKSFEDAARAVLADDERLWLAATENTETGEAIRAGLTSAVYLKGRAAIDR